MRLFVLLIRKKMFHVKQSILKFSLFGFTQIEAYKMFHVKHSNLEEGVNMFSRQMFHVKH